MRETKDWRRICADCQEGKPPKDCEYYGEPRGCNAPTYGGPPPRYYEELQEENKRLRAALKPVLEVYISQDDNSVSVYDSRLDAAYALNAVREAKRIYNDGEERIAPLRNCDVLSKDEVLEMLKDRSFSKEDTIEWLYDEAKGEIK